MIYLQAARRVVLLTVFALAAGCRSAGPVTMLPASTATGATTQAPAATATARPAATATRQASATPGATATPAPTSIPASATPTGTSETVTLLWAPEAPLVDSDDIEEIIAALKRRPGILDGSGSELSLSITYDPAIISAGRIIVIMRGMGYPVVRP